MTTLLAIDAGNTRIKWGVYEDRERTSGGAVGHDDLVRIFAPVSYTHLTLPTKRIV